MKADLYNAQARTAGSGGIAHRTAAGFVVLTSADGTGLIELINEKQSESDLIDRIVAYATETGPEAFAMLFTAGGDLYLIASGTAMASISSPSTQLSLSPAPGQVLVHPLSAGINETSANIRLRTSDDETASVTNVALQAGTIEAEWVEVAVGGATIDIGTFSSPSAAAVADDDYAADEELEAAPIDDDEPAEASPAAEAVVDSGDSGDDADAAQADADDVEAADEAHDPDSDADDVDADDDAGDDLDAVDLDAVDEAHDPDADADDVDADDDLGDSSDEEEEPDSHDADDGADVEADVNNSSDENEESDSDDADDEADASIAPAAVAAVAGGGLAGAMASNSGPPADDINLADDGPAGQAPVADPGTSEPAAPASPEPAPAPAAAAQAPAEPAPAAAEPAPAPAAAAAAEPAPAPVPAAAEPAPAPAAPVPAPAVGGPVMVLGVACSQGHHNHPDAVYCSQCGTKMGVHHTTVLLNGPRPPLGVLVVDDGTTYSLNEDLVVGREPTSHEDVIAGTASPMILTDETLSLSRKHARIILDEWQVAVQDLGSSNGTYLSRSGSAEAWTRVASGSTTPLEPGDRLRVGGRVIQVELHHVR